MIMQTMTDANCIHRVAIDAFAPTPTVLATVILSSPMSFVFAPGFSGHQHNGHDLTVRARWLCRLDRNKVAPRELASIAA